MQPVRVFVSSPGDVGREREVAERVIARVSAEFAGRAIVDPYFWEHEPMHAGADFQGQIPPPAQFQIFIGILWSRLGSRLHSQHTRPDGSSYRSGTEFEFENALEAYRKSDQHTPRVLIYRRTEIPSFPAEPPALRKERESQWEGLKSFIERCFHDVTDGGTFKAAFNTYGNTADFEERLENHLRKLLLEFVGETKESPREGPPAIWTKGSPYRGLKTFEFEHASVFFGRTQSIDQVIGQLLERSREGTPPFLLIFGSSGSGKSSLLRAGVLPAIVRGGVDGIGLWRRALMQPSQTAGDLFDGLAGALTQPNAVPELLVGGMTEKKLAETLRVNPSMVGMLLQGALPQIAQHVHEAEKQRLNTLAVNCRTEGRSADAEYVERLARELRYPEPRLVIALDQLEEMFTHEERFSVANRAEFFSAISSLLESQFVWVIATLRSDFFARCEELPDLIRLKSGKGQFHLLAATGAELAQMIRLPAQAAGVRFEDHPTYGRLEDILRDAAMAGAGSLPLLEFALENLFQAGSSRGVLTFADYSQLSRNGEGLRGILVNVAEEVYAKLSDDGRAAFPRFFLNLATLASTEASVTGATQLRYTRRVWRPMLPLGRGDREVHDKFVHSRLLVADADAHGHELVSVAHEALLNEWPRLCELLESEIRILRMRSRISVAAAQWSQEGRTAARLATGVTLAEGREVAARGIQLDADERDFIRLSVQQSRRRYVLAALSAASLVLVFAALACMAVLNARQASHSKSETQRVLALSDLARGEEFFDSDQSDNALVHLARAAESPTDVARPAAERLWFALTERVWPLPISTVMKHHDSVLSVTMSPDGKLIGTGGKDGTACVWESETGRLIAVTPQFRKPVRVVCFKPNDGQSLLTGCVDGILTLWRLGTNQITPIWTAEHPDEVTSAVFSPTGQFVVTGCRDGNTRVWSGGEGKQVWEFPGKQNVHTVVFLPNNDDVFLAISAKTARLLQISQRKELHSWSHKGDINAAAFTSDGKLLATAGDVPGVQLWDVATGDAVGKPIAHEREVTDLRFSANEKLFATVSGGKAFVWNLDGSPALQRPLPVSGPVSVVRFSLDGLRIYTGTDDGRVQTWSMLDGSALGEPVRERAQITAMLPHPDNLHLIVTTAEGATRNWLVPTLLPVNLEFHHPGAVEMMDTTGDGQTIITACGDGKARIWKDTGKVQQPNVIDDSGKVVSVAISSKGTYAATGGSDAMLRIWKVIDGKLLGAPVSLDTTITKVSFSSSEELVAAGSQGGMVRVYQLPNVAQSWENAEHKDGLRALVFDRNGTRLACGWNAGAIEVRATPSGRLVGEPIVAGRELSTLDLSPSGKLLVSGDGEGVVQLWQTNNGHKQGPSLIHKAAVQALTFSPDEQFFVSGSDDGTAVVWKTANGKPVSAAFQLGKPVSSLAVNGDSSRVATGTEDGSVHVWDVAVGQLISERLVQNDAIRGLAFVSGGAMLASASSDGTVRLTDVQSPLRRSDYGRLAGLAYAFSSVSLEPSGRLAWHEVPRVAELQSLCVASGQMERFCQWFFADRTRRTLTPFAITTVHDVVLDAAKEIQPNRKSWALLVAAGDPHLSKEVLATGQ